VSTPRPGAAPDPFVHLLRPYSRLLAEEVLHELRKRGGPDIRGAVDAARSAMSRAVRSAHRRPGTDADGQEAVGQDPVADVAVRLERLGKGGTILPVANTTRRDLGRRAEVRLTTDVLAYVAEPAEVGVDALLKPDVAAAFLEEFTEGHVRQAAELLARASGDPNVLDVLTSRGLATVTAEQAAEIVAQDEETPQSPPRPVGHAGWALLTDEDLLRALHGRRSVLLEHAPKIGAQLNLVLAEHLCLIGPAQVGWGSDAWQEHDGPHPLQHCADHPDPFDGAKPERGQQSWSKGVYVAMDQAMVRPRCGTVSAGSPVDDWIEELVTTQRAKLIQPPGAGKPRVVFVGQGADGGAHRLDSRMTTWLSRHTTALFRTYVQVCIDARLAIGW
jgi:hypothetical protein